MTPVPDDLRWRRKTRLPTPAGRSRRAAPAVRRFPLREACQRRVGGHGRGELGVSVHAHRHVAHGPDALRAALSRQQPATYTAVEPRGRTAMPDLVCTGATLRCSYGTATATFSATGAKVSAGATAGVVS